MVSTPNVTIVKERNKIFVQTTLEQVTNHKENKEQNINSKHALDQFLRFLKQHNYSENTIESYGKTIQQILYQIDVSSLSQECLNEIQLKLVETYQHNGNRLRFAAINLFCKKILCRDDLYLSIPRSKTVNKDILTNDQIETIFDIAKRKRGGIYAMIQTLYDCALRKSEICALNITDVNFETLELFLRNTKTGDEIVSMTTRVAQAIQSYIQEERHPENPGESALFLNKYGRRIGEHFVRNHFKECAHEAGISGRVYPHILRASCITHLLNKGVNPLTVQRHARHKDFRTTMIYNRPTHQQMKADLERIFTSENKDVLRPKQLKPDDEFIGYA